MKKGASTFATNEPFEALRDRTLMLTMRHYTFVQHTRSVGASGPHLVLWLPTLRTVLFPRIWNISNRIDDMSIRRVAIPAMWAPGKLKLAGAPGLDDCIHQVARPRHTDIIHCPARAVKGPQCVIKYFTKSVNVNFWNTLCA